MRALPAHLPAFLRAAAAASEVGYLAPEPDRIRGAGLVQDREHDPAHFVDAYDDLSVMGGPPLKALPPTREEFDTALRDAGQSQYKAGYLPYSIIGGYELVRKHMALWRLAVAGARYAPTQAERARYAADRPRREARLLNAIGLWSHFVGDGSQPLHVTIHYNGWGDFPNPQGFTTERIHTPFESDYVRANISAAMVRAAMPAPRDCGCAINQRVSEYLLAGAAQVEPLIDRYGHLSALQPAQISGAQKVLNLDAEFGVVSETRLTEPALRRRDGCARRCDCRRPCLRRAQSPFEGKVIRQELVARHQQRQQRIVSGAIDRRGWTHDRRTHLGRCRRAYLR